MSPSRTVTIKRLTHESEAEFARIHCDATGNGWCHCVAWWVPTWDGWGERTSGDNEALRQKLFEDGVHDGYLIYADDVLAGWCQVWKRDAFAKLAAQFDLPSDDSAWMIGCILVLPTTRQQGVARIALGLIVSDLRLRGARTVDAYPKRSACDDGELWNGAESTYLRLGFAVARDDPKRPVLRLSL
jgi:GNAT superfamily N-acetyltransferase